MKTIKTSDLTIYPDEREVYRMGRFIKLSKKEYDLLEFLILNKGRIFNRNTLLEYVWHYSTDILTNTVDVHMARLRRKIDLGYEKKLIHTVFGIGYRLT